MVSVPAIADMSDDTFMKHMNLRHADEVIIPLGRMPNDFGIVASMRHAHRYWHMDEPEKYDHDHRTTILEET